MGKKRVKTTVKKKKKSWYGILAPDIFNNVNIGETPTSDPLATVGRKMKVNLMTLTRNIKNQNITITLKLDSFKDSLFRTKFLGYEISQSSIKRLVRRKRDRIDDSYVIKTKDGVSLRVKTILLTKSKTNSSVRTAIRKKAIEYITEKTAETTFSDMIQVLVMHKVQSDIAKYVSKIYPVRIFEFRVLRIEEGKKKPGQIAPQVAEEPKEEEKEEEQEDTIEVRQPEQEETEEKADKKAASEADVEADVEADAEAEDNSEEE